MTTYSAREQRGWYMYDFANSAFSTTVVTLFLGPYLTALAKAAAAPDGYDHPFGMSRRSAQLLELHRQPLRDFPGAVPSHGRRGSRLRASKERGAGRDRLSGRGCHHGHVFSRRHANTSSAGCCF